MLRRYFQTLSAPKIILWCYLLWYLVILCRYFDPNPRIWLTSLGLGIIIGFALYLNATASVHGKANLDRWQIIRLFLMPFFVSSFAALVKGRNFILIFSPQPKEIVFALLLCAAFCALVGQIKSKG